MQTYSFSMPAPLPRAIAYTLLTGVFTLVTGCATPRPAAHVSPTTQLAITGLESPRLMPEASAWVNPPLGWRLDKHDVDAKHTHLTWLSPSGDTAYGVVLMNLPLPVGPDMVLWGFLNHLKAADKQAEILQQERAPDLQGIRFIADSGLYRIRVNLSVHDWHAWAVYAGTVREKPVNTDELVLAERARDHTRVNAR